ncbi:MAG: ABC transporter permease subunit, partial [Oscillospiraceae bacterium]|nr:ABC transporter permease subunit [Oscillospiraceae bacterium]
MAAKVSVKKASRFGKRGLWGTVWLQRELLIMSVPLVIYKFIFSYVPLSGWVMAFQNFRPTLGTYFNERQEWVGWSNFTALFANTQTGRAFRNALLNTFGQSVLTLILGYVCAIGLSLLLNELRHVGFKRIIQNILYLPHFLSWIIVAGMVQSALTTDGGIVNEVLMALHVIREPIRFFGEANYFWGIVAGSHLWKSLGWNTIIYMAAMTAIDGTLYEAADIDGANRYHKMWHITLPSIKPTIVILMMMSLGYMLDSGFEIQYLLGNAGVLRSRAENLDVFVVNYALGELNRFSLATAAGIFKTTV